MATLIKFLAALSALFLFACTQQEQVTTGLSIKSELQARIDELQEAAPEVPGFAIYVQKRNGDGFGAATGVANPDGVTMTSDRPVRIASITKTFVAATVLRLWEDGKIDLEAPITSLIDPAFNAILQSDNYDTNAITVRHLLMHSSGMPDHAGQEYVVEVSSDPQRSWTRTDQVEFLVTRLDPIGEPGGQFIYSDTGYILLGDIIERITQKPLHVAVREQLSFASIGLENVWWDVFESKPEGALPRAHQYLGGLDVYDWNGTADAYGGGGLIASVKDLAVFFSALFEGGVYKSDETLAVMINAPGQPSPDSYRIGLQSMKVCGKTIYAHSGFWGLLTVRLPEQGVSMAGVALDQAGYRGLIQLMNETAEEVVGGCE